MRYNIPMFSFYYILKNVNNNSKPAITGIVCSGITSGLQKECKLRHVRVSPLRKVITPEVRLFNKLSNVIRIYKEGVAPQVKLREYLNRSSYCKNTLLVSKHNSSVNERIGKSRAKNAAIDYTQYAWYK